jgi:hypothetical protein
MITLVSRARRYWNIDCWEAIDVANCWIKIDEIHRLFVRSAMFCGPVEIDIDNSESFSWPCVDIIDATLVVGADIPTIFALNTHYTEALLKIDDVQNCVIQALDNLMESRE